MPETRAYKLNEKKQPAATEGMFLYYFYDRGKLTSVEVDEYKFERLGNWIPRRTILTDARKRIRLLMSRLMERLITKR